MNAHQNRLDRFIEWVTRNPRITFVILLKDLYDLLIEVYQVLKTGKFTFTVDWWDLSIKAVVAVFLYNLLRYLRSQIDKISQVENTLNVANDTLQKLNIAVWEATNSHNLLSDRTQTLSLYINCANLVQTKATLASRGQNVTDMQVLAEHNARREQIRQMFSVVFKEKTQLEIDEILNAFHGPVM